MSYKLLTYLSPSGPSAGILVGERVYATAELSGNPNYGSVLGVLADWQNADRMFTGLSSGDAALKGGIALADANLLAPVLYPGQIFAAGANYQDHIEEMKSGEFKAQNAKLQGGRPWFFSKSSRSAVIGHDAVRPLPPYSSKVDWEIELAVVIGRPASRVPAAQALEYVAGYTIANDLSARDFVAREGIDSNSPFRYDWVAHKGFDGACPLGPWIIPARDIPDPQNLDLRLWVDENQMQNSNTKHMIFTIAEQIEELSSRVTLNPGDLILTGTPSGVGMGRNIFLKSGQKIRLWIEKIGELRHSFS